MVGRIGLERFENKLATLQDDASLRLSRRTGELTGTPHGFFGRTVRALAGPTRQDIEDNKAILQDFHRDLALAFGAGIADLALLQARADARHTAGYPAVVARMGMEDGSGRTADVMDVPRAIAEIAAMPAGTRPLRRPVSGGGIPQTEINAVSAKAQLAMLGNSPLAPLVRGVLD